MNIVGLNNGNKLTASDLYDTTQAKTQADFNASLSYNMQTCFHMAYCTGGGTTLNGILKLTNIITSIGNAYDSSTGLFTCPVKGLYFVSFNYFSTQTTADTAKRPTIFKNSTPYIIGNSATQSLSTVVYCMKGDTLAIGCCSGNLNIYKAYCHIEGVFVLIKPLT